MWTKNFIIICAANFFLFLAYYYLLVTIPSAAMESMGTSGMVAGLFTTVFLIAAIVTRPFMGAWVNRAGKRPMYILSMIVYFLASCMYSFCESEGSLLFVRFIHGIGFGMATTITGAIVADILPYARKGEGMGYFAVSTNLAMVAGPFLGLTINGEWGIQMMFWFSALFSLCALLTGWLTKVPADTEKETRSHQKKHSVFERAAVPIALTGAFFAIAYSAILSFIAVFATERGLAAESSYFFVVYAVGLLVTRPFTGRWFDKYGANFIVFPAIVLYALGMYVLSITSGAMVFFMAAAMIGIGWGTLFPSFQTLALYSTSPGRRPLANATFFSVFDLGIGVGSFLIGSIAGHISLGGLYLYCAIYVVLGIGLYYWAQKQRTIEGIREIEHKEA
ncbi:MFS transporter [Bacillus sp. M6-12]|uniref:MFS transporter n=1 Tax=Bacillus sp. M6-12 TaxID=2054166 RepID=UPI0021550FD7|nr:MFS transporter [Bacillus sp. M6-12]